MSKEKTINVAGVYEVKARPGPNGGFRLIFHNGRQRVVLHLDRTYVGHIGDQLWRIVRHEHSAIECLKSQLRGG